MNNAQCLPISCMQIINQDLQQSKPSQSCEYNKKMNENLESSDSNLIAQNSYHKILNYQTCSTSIRKNKFLENTAPNLGQQIIEDHENTFAETVPNYPFIRKTSNPFQIKESLDDITNRDKKVKKNYELIQKMKEIKLRESNSVKVPVIEKNSLKKVTSILKKPMQEEFKTTIAQNSPIKSVKKPQNSPIKSVKNPQNSPIESVKNPQITINKFLHLLANNYTKDFQILISNYNFEALKDFRFKNGWTILHMMTHLSTNNKDYLKVIIQLIHYGVDPLAKDNQGWWPINEAAGFINIEAMSLQFDYMIQKKQNSVQKKNIESNNIIHNLKDFYTELKWRVKTKFLPSSLFFIPKDTLKIWKFQNFIRIDFSMIKDKKGLNFKKRWHSLIINQKQDPAHILTAMLPIDIFLLDHSKNSYCMQSEKFNHEEKVNILESWLKFVQYKNQTLLNNINIKYEKEAKVNKYDCGVYKVECNIYEKILKKDVILKRINPDFLRNINMDDVVSQTDIFDNFNKNKSCQSSLDSNNPNRKKGEEIQLKAQIWSCKDYGINFDDFNKILSLISIQNPYFKKQNLFHHYVISNEKDIQFPLKVEIPIKTGIYGQIKFKNYKNLNSEKDVTGLFDIPKLYTKKTRLEFDHIFTNTNKLLKLAEYVFNN